MESTFTNTGLNSTIYVNQNRQVATLVDLYNRYAPALYGEIKRNLFQQNICNQTLADAYQQIWENIENYDNTKGSLFSWCFRIVRKEIQKKKVELMLKEIVACQPFVEKNAVSQHC